MEWKEADLEHWDKNYSKVKNLTKEVNNYLISEREKALYFEEKGYFPEEYDWPEWKQGIERTRYVKKLTERNPTSTAKRPTHAKIHPPVHKEPWKPPKEEA